MARTELTRQHFELIAAELRELDPGDADLGRSQTHKAYTGQVARALQKINPRFDADRFHDACLKQGEPHGPR